MGDFNFAQFLGGILKGGGESLGYGMPVIPRKPNAPPTIEMTPSQTAASDIVKGAGSEIALSRPVVQPAGGAGVISPPIMPGKMMPARGLFHRAGGDDYGSQMRQMRSGGITDPLEKVEVHDRETVQGLPDGRVIVTPAEETVDVSQESSMSPQPPAEISTDVREQVVNPQYSEATNELATDRSADISADRPPVMSIPDTVKPGMDDEEGVQKAILDNLEIKPSPWKDLGASLIQAADNYFNKKNEPIRTWGEIKRDKKIAPLAARLALIKDAKASRQASEEKAARIGLIGAQTKTIGEDDARLRDNLNRQIAKDENSEKIAMRRLDQGDVKAAQGWLKLAQTDELMRLRDKWALADDEINKKRVALIEQEVRNRQTRHNENLDFNKQKQGQLQTYRGAALKIAAAKKGSDGSPENEAKIKKAETALDLSLRRAVKSELMSQEEADEIRSEQIRGFLNGGVDPIDE